MNKKLLSFGAICLFVLTSLVSVSCGEGPVNNSLSSNENSASLNEDGDPYVASLEVVTQPRKTVYNEGEKFDGAGMTLKAVWSHVDEETGKNIVEELTASDVKYSKEPLVGGTTYIEVSYENASVKIDIQVKSVEMTGLVVTHLPEVTTLTVDKKFTTKGLVLSAQLADGSTMVIEDGYTVSIDGKDVTSEVASEGVSLTLGSHQVVLSYKDKTTSFNVEVINGVLHKIEAENVVGTDSYSEGDKNYIEFNDNMLNSKKTHIRADTSEPASGGKYLGELNAVGRGFTVHFYSEVATKASFSICISSSVVEENASKGNNDWNPTKMKDVYLGQVAKMKVNNSDYKISDSTVVKGGKLDDVGGIHSHLWVYWQTVDLGQIDLVKGDNKIYIEIYNVMKAAYNLGDATVNIDYFNFNLTYIG